MTISSTFLEFLRIFKHLIEFLWIFKKHGIDPFQLGHERVKEVQSDMSTSGLGTELITFLHLQQ